MMDSNFWTAVAIAAIAPFIGLLAAIWKLRREGISAASIEEIRDRARFRAHMMERLRVVEERERELIARHENRERSLLNQISDLHLKVEALEQKLREEMKGEAASSKSERDRIEGRLQKEEEASKAERDRIEARVKKDEDDSKVEHDRLDERIEETRREQRSRSKEEPKE